MSVERVEVLVEEPSMEAALRALLPRMLGSVSFEVYAFSCKSQLLKELPKRLRGYASWLPDTWRVVVVIDRDDEPCRKVKRTLEAMANKAGLATRTTSRQRYAVVNRVAIEELEAWYFGDWAAVRKAYPRVTEGVDRQAKFRAPDAITGGTWEAFERCLQKVGYFTTGLRKIEAAGAIAPHMDPMRNTSPSFCSLRDVLMTEMGQP
jgi:hypothetical protein